MKTLKKGTRVPMSNGMDAIIQSLIGEGGQGAVYLCQMGNKPYALKVYNRRPSKEFIANLENNIKKGAPTAHFLWPISMIASKQFSGYVMNLREKDYVDFSKFLLAKVRFASWSAVIRAALQITCAFRVLHRRGLSYQDLNDGNFFFNPQTGDVRICDNDNVCPSDINLGIKGKCRYMAPEVVTGKSQPNDLSDYFSLSVILFMLLMNNHPLDGRRVASVPCLNDEIERNVYGEHPLFIYDATNADNRPVAGVHCNVLRRWGLFPKFVQQAFEYAFSQEVMMNPNKRWADNDWIRMLVQLRNQTILCTCGQETFYDLDKTQHTCFNCKGTLPKVLTLHVNNQRIALYPGMLLYAQQTDKDGSLFVETGRVAVSKNNASIWGIANKTKSAWLCTMPNGQNVEVPAGKGCPIYKGVSIDFGNQQGKIE